MPGGPQCPGREPAPYSADVDAFAIVSNTNEEFAVAIDDLEFHRTWLSVLGRIHERLAVDQIHHFPYGRV
jgi:hypothetical protein